MMFSRRALAGMALVVGTLTSGTVLAHRTGNERRTVPQCNALRDPARRAACLACIARPRPHHYHPLQTEGWRCDPNDGTP
jgi:hypothetical protein